MKVWRWILAVCFGGMVLTGCQETGMKAYDRFELGDARDTVATAVEAMGGLSAWRKVDKVQADAVVTYYTSDGQAYVNHQSQEMDFSAGRIEATAKTATGRWSATYRRGGRFNVSGEEALGVLSADELKQALAIILHRAGGPLNLLGKGEKIGEVSNVFVAGLELNKVHVHGGEFRQAEYYFDATSGLLQLLAVPGEQAGTRGTVAIYTYQILPNGLVFPKRIEVRRIGDYALIGEKKLLDVEFTNVRI